MIKIKNVVTAYKARQNPQLLGVIDIFGSFDNLVQPFFPFVFENLLIVITLENLEKPTIFEIRLNDSSDGLMFKNEVEVYPDVMSIGKKIMSIENLSINDRGRYTMDILKKEENGERKFIKTVDLFMADYPQQRIITDEERRKILSSEGLVKVVKTEVNIRKNSETLKLQINLDKNEAIDEGFIAIPTDDKIEIGDKIYRLTGIRRQAEWLFGTKLEAEKKE